jgi:hypothetical protein
VILPCRRGASCAIQMRVLFQIQKCRKIGQVLTV